MSTATNTHTLADTLDAIVTRPASAETIRTQIGVRALMCCGARKLAAHRGSDSEGTFTDGLQFDVSRGGRFLVIVLAADDTYTVLRGRRTRRAGLPVVVLDDNHVDGVRAIATDVYCENLARVVIKLGDVA